jgi:hypothetical protein
MRLTSNAASSIASALPSCRVLLLLGGVLALSESVALATTLFAGALVSFAASLAIATTIYRRAAPRLTEQREHAAPNEAASAAARR